MAHATALVIAVETYRDPKIPRVRFAESDARALAAALAAAGYDVKDVLLGAAATTTAVTSTVRRLLQQAAPDERVCLFFAGHGFDGGGDGYLMAADTILADAVATSVPLSAIFDAMNTSPSAQVLLLLDASHAGLEFDAGADDSVSPFSVAHLHGHFATNDQGLCLVSCRADETSYVSREHGRGIWTLHLLEALRGQAPSALVKGRYVTAEGLQAYLESAVPKTLRATHPARVTQRPMAFGPCSADVEIADLVDVLAARASSTQVGVEDVKDIALWWEERVPVTAYGGFDKKRNSVPDAETASAARWYQRLAHDEVAAELAAVRARLRQHYKYKRKELQLTQDDDVGAIETPDFHFSIAVGQDSQDPGQALIRTEIVNLRDADVLKTPAFEAVFDASFQGLDLRLGAAMDVEALIDRLEETEPEGWGLDYEDAADFVVLTHAALPLAVRVDAGRIRLKATQPMSAADLLGAVERTLGCLGGAGALPVLAPR